MGPNALVPLSRRQEGKKSVGGVCRIIHNARDPCDILSYFISQFYFISQLKQTVKALEKNLITFCRVGGRQSARIQDTGKKGV